MPGVESGVLYGTSTSSYYSTGYEYDDEYSNYRALQIANKSLGITVLVPGAYSYQGRARGRARTVLYDDEGLMYEVGSDKRCPDVAPN